MSKKFDDKMVKIINRYTAKKLKNNNPKDEMDAPDAHNYKVEYEQGEVYPKYTFYWNWQQTYQDAMANGGFYANKIVITPFDIVAYITDDKRVMYYIAEVKNAIQKCITKNRGELKTPTKTAEEEVM